MTNYFDQKLTFRVWTLDWAKSIAINANIAKDKGRFTLLAKNILQTSNIQWELSLGAKPDYYI